MKATAAPCRIQSDCCRFAAVCAAFLRREQRDRALKAFRAELLAFPTALALIESAGT
jgi:hypothetical protein